MCYHRKNMMKMTTCRSKNLKLLNIEFLNFKLLNLENIFKKIGYVNK